VGETGDENEKSFDFASSIGNRKIKKIFLIPLLKVVLLIHLKNARIL